VVLHGHGGSARSAFEDGLLLQDHVEATRLAVVSVDGGDSYWHARSNGTDTGAMVTDELLPLALRTVGLPAGTPPTLLGWSMGGFGALWLARVLGRTAVTAVVAESAALWHTGAETPQGAYDDREDFDQHSVLAHPDALAGIPVRLDCGTSDPFISANRELASRLRAVTPTFDTGGHTTGYWRDHAGAQLRWVAAQQPQ
jgi:enterochelin esterase-like enzyme